jgi:hypothetical protein
MSLPYNDLPVYVGTENTYSIVERNNYLPVTQMNVSHNTTFSPRRSLGSAILTGDQFAFNQALQATISFSCILDDPAAQGPYYFASKAASTQNNFYPIKIGDNIYNRCYLTSMSMNIAPFTPVTLNATFTSLDPAINQQISGDYSLHSSMPSMTGDHLFYGHTCQVVNMGNAVGDVQSNISFKRTLNSTPVYTLGSGQATSMLLDGVEEEMQISSTGLKTLINYSGEILNSATQVNIINPYGATLDGLEVLEMSAGARVLTEGYNINGGDTVGATATIKQVTL